MPDIHFNKNAGKNSHPYNYDDFEDISSNSGAKPGSIRMKDGKVIKRVPSPGHPEYNGNRNINSGSGGNHKTPKKRKRRKNKGLRILLSIILVFALIYVGIANLVFGNLDYAPNEHPKNPYKDSSELMSSPSVKNILLLGVDAREGETVSRSDTMMLVSIDQKHRKIKLTSFLRDSYVEIPGHGQNKLNAACAFGGIPLVIQTLEYNYGVKIDSFMSVNFKTFVSLIDALGGVNVPVTEREANFLNRHKADWNVTEDSNSRLEYNFGDDVHLNGEQALKFCRIRELDSDIMRTKRQRLVISAVKNSAMHMTPSKLMEISKNVTHLVKTDINKYDMTNLAIKALISYRKYEIAQTSIPKKGSWHNETNRCGMVLAFNIPENAQYLQDFIYQDIPVEEQE